MLHQKFVFDYRLFPAKDPATGRRVHICRPFIPVKVSLGGKDSPPILSPVDSGSDYNLFPAALGVLVGLDIKNGTEKRISGIGGFQMRVYTWEVELNLLSESLGNLVTFNTKVDFSYEQQIPLLGRDGFFNLFRSIEFRERRKLLELRV